MSVVLRTRRIIESTLASLDCARSHLHRYRCRCGAPAGRRRRGARSQRRIVGARDAEHQLQLGIVLLGKGAQVFFEQRFCAAQRHQQRDRRRRLGSLAFAPPKCADAAIAAAVYPSAASAASSTVSAAARRSDLANPTPPAFLIAPGGRSRLREAVRSMESTSTSAFATRSPCDQRVMGRGALSDAALMTILVPASCSFSHLRTTQRAGVLSTIAAIRRDRPPFAGALSDRSRAGRRPARADRRHLAIDTVALLVMAQVSTVFELTGAVVVATSR